MAENEAAYESLCCVNSTCEKVSRFPLSWSTEFFDIDFHLVPLSDLLDVEKDCHRWIAEFTSQLGVDDRGMRIS